MFFIKIAIETETAHRLQNHHRLCQHLHGHSYKWEISIGSHELNDDGMVMDFGDLKHLVHSELDQFDHAIVLQNSDPLLGINPPISKRIVTLPSIPTAEFMAKYVGESIIFQMGQHDHMYNLFLSYVNCRETSNNEATYIPE
jgi:6-pyruvoyltetrahydropterin/6-carboxytetrahydropterin synthase